VDAVRERRRRPLLDCATAGFEDAVPVRPFRWAKGERCTRLASLSMRASCAGEGPFSSYGENSIDHQQDQAQPSDMKDTTLGD